MKVNGYYVLMVSVSVIDVNKGKPQAPSSSFLAFLVFSCIKIKIWTLTVNENMILQLY